MQDARLGQLIYIVRDMEACVAFYRDVVGLPLKFRDGDRWAAFRLGEITLGLAKEGTEAGVPGCGAMVAFRVEDLSAFASEVAARNQAQLPDIQVGAHELRLALRDPSGNSVIFYQPSPRPLG